MSKKSRRRARQARAAQAAAEETRSWGGGGLGAGALLGGMRSGAPGQWSDNRYEQARHFLGVAFTAIRAFCDGMASVLPAITTSLPSRDEQKAKRSKGGKTRASGTSAPLGKESRRPVRPDYPLVGLLENPNPQDTLPDLLYEISLQRRLTSSALLWEVPDKRNIPCELYVIPAALATALPRSAQYPNGAWRVSPLQPSGPFAILPGPVTAGGAVIPAEQITQLKSKHPLYRYDGYSPLSADAVQLDILEMIDLSRWSAFHQGVTPSAVLEVDPVKGANIKQADLNALQARLDEKYAGSANYGKLMVLLGGMALKPWGVAAGEIGFENGWAQIRDFVLSLLGVPKGVVGITEATNYSTLYAALKTFYLLTLRPECQVLGAHLTKFLAWRFHRSLRIDFELPALDDPQLLETQLANDLRARARTRNEWRALRNLPPLPGDVGEELVGYSEERINANPDPAGFVGDTAPDNPAGQGSLGPRKSLRRRYFSTNGTNGAI